MLPKRGGKIKEERGKQGRKNRVLCAAEAQRKEKRGKRKVRAKEPKTRAEGRVKAGAGCSVRGVEKCGNTRTTPVSSLEDISGKRRLTDNGKQGASADFVVIGYDNGRRHIQQALLHHDMAAFAADFDEAVISEQSTELSTGENSETTQPLPRVG